MFTAVKLSEWKSISWSFSLAVDDVRNIPNRNRSCRFVCKTKCDFPSSIRKLMLSTLLVTFVVVKKLSTLFATQSIFLVGCYRVQLGSKVEGAAQKMSWQKSCLRSHFIGGRKLIYYSHSFGFAQASVYVTNTSASSIDEAM